MYLTFLQVADSGSFSQAAKVLFISTVAVMKQINALENQLGVRLLLRSTRGVQLTQAGERLYAGTTEMIKSANVIIEQTKEIGRNKQLEIKVGVSLMRPGTPLISIWQKHQPNLRQYKFEMIPISDDDVTLKTPSAKIGSEIDCIVGPCDSQDWSRHYSIAQLGMDQFQVAVPQTNPLVAKRQLSIADLNGQTIIFPPKNVSSVLDQMVVDLEKDYPGITIKHTSNFYNTEVFNRYVNFNNLLLTRGSWRGLQPSMKTIPVDWTYQSPYGVIYSKTPSQKMIDFIRAIRKSLSE